MAQIKLEDTLCEFFASEARHSNPEEFNKIFISYNPISEVDLASELPRNRKYITQQWRRCAGDRSATINLVLMPQRMAWMVGKMPVVFFKKEKPENQEDTIFNTVESDLAKTLSIIDAQSRFQPVFGTSRTTICKFAKNSTVIPYLPADGLDAAHYTHPDIHYELLSKRGLALSGLPTPRAQLVDFDLPEGGWTDAIIDKEVARAVSAIRNNTRPFVLKTNCAGGGKGTYIIHTKAEQAAVEHTITNHLPSELSNLTLENAHLHPCSLILTAFLPGHSVSVNFYVRNDGKAQFSSCCEQEFSAPGLWSGGTITYSEQRQLAVSHDDIIQATAKFLRSRGYHGPAGVDLVQTESGHYEIVDLNPRPTGTFVLGCLRSHFVDGLRFNQARVLPFKEFSASREEFERAFQKELDVGQIIVLAWCSNPLLMRSHTCLAAGAKDAALLHELCQSIQTWVDQSQ